MSDENAQIVRRAHDAWSSGDLPRLLALSDADIEYVNSPTAVETGVRHGSEGFAAVLRAQWEVLTDARLEIERMDDRGEDIVTLSRLSRRMPESDARIAVEALILWRVRMGRLIRIEVLGAGTGVRDALVTEGLNK